MPIKVNKDIDNIIGATLSCKHLADGVKRVMVMYDLALKSYKYLTLTKLINEL